MPMVVGRRSFLLAGVRGFESPLKNKLLILSLLCDGKIKIGGYLILVLGGGRGLAHSRCRASFWRCLFVELMYHVSGTQRNQRNRVNPIA